MIYVSHLLRDEEMREIVEATGAGVECIEFSVGDNLDCFSQTMDSYEKRLRAIGTTDVIFHGPFLDLNPAAYDRDILAVTRKRYQQAYEAAEYFGARKVVYHTGRHPAIYWAEGWAERVSDFYREFLEGKTIPIVMENLYEWEWDCMLDVVKTLDTPMFQLCLDIGHAHCFSHRSVQEWAEGIGPYVSHVHIHDNKGDTDSHLALGEGTVPFRESMECLGTGERTYTIECCTKEAVLKSMEALGFLRGKLGRI